MTFNFFDFVFLLISKIEGLFTTLYNFLFYEIDISPVVNFFEKIVAFFGGSVEIPFDSIQLWALLSGTGLIAVLIIVLIKKIIPLF